MSHGWRVVAFCFLAAVFTWGLGVFGASVYLHEVTKARGWSVSLVSAGITVFYLTAALVLPAVGTAIDRRGSRPVIAGGAVLLAFGVAAMGYVAAPWQLYAAFVCMGLGYATMSVIGLSATVAPWFERYQGRAIAMALTGASVGAMVVVPLVALSIARHGFSATATGAAAVATIMLVPLALVVLRYRGPAELGLGRDGQRHQRRAPGPRRRRRGLSTGASVARPLERGGRLRARTDRPGRILHPPGQACRASAGRDRGRLAGGRDRPGRAPGPPCSWSGSPTGSSCGATLRPSSPPRRWPSC